MTTKSDSEYQNDVCCRIHLCTQTGSPGRRNFQEEAFKTSSRGSHLDLTFVVARAAKTWWTVLFQSSFHGVFHRLISRANWSNPRSKEVKPQQVNNTGANHKGFSPRQWNKGSAVGLHRRPCAKLRPAISGISHRKNVIFAATCARSLPQRRPSDEPHLPPPGSTQLP